MTQSIYTCALWYWQYHSADYELFATEEDAASYALYMHDAGSGAPAGVQFADGRLVRLDEWPAYVEAEDRRDEAERQRREEYKAKPPPAVRKMGVPFGREGEEIAIEVTEPTWLGLSPEGQESP